jgi:transcriptional activator HAC1
LLVFVDNKEKQRIQSSSKTSPPTVEMDSWAAHTPTPNLKFENSPAESLLSTPEEMFPSLFGSEASSNMPTLNPIDMMSPQSLRDITPDVSVLAGLQSTPGTPSEASPAPEKKPVKKRKSWGQVLPEPKTNLPPRKRAKTEDEKEQRRVERVLRNRRAAQSSRERKRQEVEGLEQRNKELQEQLRQSQAANIALMNELRKFQRTPGVMARAPATFDTLRPSPLTLSQELFSSQDSHGLSTDNATLEQLLSSLPTNNTVNPASLSPTLTPVPEADEENEPATTVASFDSTTIVNTSPDATQHPAVSVGGSATVVGVAAGAAGASTSPISSDVHLDNGFSVSTPVDPDSYVLESGLLSSPNSSDFEYDHFTGDQSFSFAPTEFDINDFITDDHVPTTEQQPQHQSYNRAVADSSLFNPETQVSSEDSYLQPHSGASLDGCDDGGIAVGVN